MYKCVYTPHTIVCIIVCMSKKRINITLSEEAITKADESGNRSEYIEQLIMGTLPVEPATGITEERVVALIKKYCPSKDSNAPFNDPNIYTANKISVSPTAKRSLTDIRLEIQETEDELANALEENQDPDYGRKLNMQYTKKIDDLWKEYHATKQAN